MSMRPHWHHRVERRTAAGVYLLLALAVGVPVLLLAVLAKVAT